MTLQFDDAAEQAVRRLWAAVTVPPGPGERRSARPAERYRPHVTLAAYDAPGADSLQRALKTFCAAIAPFPIAFPAVGVFLETRVVYLAPAPTGELLDLQAAVIALFAGPDGPPLKFAKHLGRGLWTPHCTVLRAGTPQKVAWCVETLHRAWAPITGTASTIGIHELGTTTDVFRCPLGG